MSTGHYELVGAVHMHTGHSDGGGGAEDIADACRRLKLDFAVVTDHDSLALRDRGEEGWHDGVLLAVGNEISTKKNFSHLLGLNVKKTTPRFEHGVHECLEYVRGQGGQALLAHAHGRGLGGKGRSRRNWPWWPHPHLRGAEIWNYLQDWGRTFRILDPGSYRLDQVPGRVAGPPGWLLAFWDAEAEKRPFAGIAGNDNHAKRLWPFRKKYWPHEDLLGRLVNRVRLDQPLSKDGSQAAKQIMNALAEGKCIFARDELASAEGFAFAAVKDEAVAHPGDTIAFEPGVKLVVESPVEAELRICRLGSVVASATGSRLEFPPQEPGAYRAEGRLPISALPAHLAPASTTRNLHPPKPAGRKRPEPLPAVACRAKANPAVAWAFSNHIRLVARSIGG